jgi:tRNA 2-thiouridine synthesizing protein A
MSSGNIRDSEATELIGSAVRKVDACGLMCPEPLILCRQAIDTIAGGERVYVTATDPHAEIDFEVFTRRSGHAFVLRLWCGGVLHAVVEKRADA